jgi:hypothetical protein
MVVDPSALVRNAINLYEAVWVRFVLSIGSTTANAWWCYGIPNQLNEVLIEPEAWMLCLAAVTGARTEH